MAHESPQLPTVVISLLDLLLQSWLLLTLALLGLLAVVMVVQTGLARARRIRTRLRTVVETRSTSPIALPNAGH